MLYASCWGATRISTEDGNAKIYSRAKALHCVAGTAEGASAPRLPPLPRWRTMQGFPVPACHYMSIEAMSWGRSQATGKPARKVVLLLLCDYAHPETKTCCPSQEYLAHMAEMGVRSLQHHLQTLAGMGLIAIRERWAAGGSRMRNEYKILMDADSAPLPHSISAKNRGHKRNELRNSNGTTASKTKTTLDAFAQAWRSYPKRLGGNSRVAAEKAWRARLAAGHTADALTDGTLRYALFCELTGKVGTEFVMMASTFFGPQLRFTEEWEVVGAQPTSRNGKQAPPTEDEASYIGTVVQ